MDTRWTALVFVAIFQASVGVRHTVYWDREKIPDLVGDGLVITLEVDDWMDILCPYVPYNRDISRYKDINEVFLQIFNVTEENYINCNTDGIRIQSCDNPSIEKKLTTKFQERSPSPFGFTFRPGATYYYISKPPEDHRRGCTRNTMRMSINVRKKNTVFREDERHYTRTYHRIKEHEVPKHEGLTPKLPQREVEKRHHHHDRATSTRLTTTRANPKPNPNHQLATAKNEEIRASAVHQQDPGNSASRTISSLTTTLATVAAVIICAYQR